MKNETNHEIHIARCYLCGKLYDTSENNQDIPPNSVEEEGGYCEDCLK